MNNPFKFGTIVDGEYFTDRVAEQEKVREILASENHLILISPRRFGKTSLVQKVTKGLSRPVFRKRLSKYIFYSSFSLLTFATKK